MPVNPDVMSTAIAVPVVPPATESFAYGDVVPTPTFPPFTNAISRPRFAGLSFLHALKSTV